MLTIERSVFYPEFDIRDMMRNAAPVEAEDVRYLLLCELERM